MIYNAEAVLRAHGLYELADYTYARLRAPRHIEYDSKTGEPLFMLCRVCGEKIAGWIDDDIVDQETSRISEGETVTKFVMRQKFRRYANCTQVKLVLSTGSLYEPLLCRDCAVQLDAGGAQECFISDLVEMVGEAMARGKDPDRAVDVVKRLAHLVVLRTGS